MPILSKRQSHSSRLKMMMMMPFRLFFCSLKKKRSRKRRRQRRVSPRVFFFFFFFFRARSSPRTRHAKFSFMKEIFSNVFFYLFGTTKIIQKKITFVFRVLHECRVLRKKGRRKKSQTKEKVGERSLHFCHVTENTNSNAQRARKKKSF